MNPKAIALQERTGKFFTRVIEFCERLRKCQATASISAQLIDSAGSTDSNYGAACRARSTDEFFAKVSVAAEEADESRRWLVRLVEGELCSPESANELIQEADELTAIFISSSKTARENQDRRKEDKARRKAETSRRR